MQQLRTLNDIDLRNQRVLIREDFNVPIDNGVVQSDLRIRAALPGIKQALAAGAQVRLMSHLGRPTAGSWQAEFSLEPVAKCLEKLLGMPVKFVRDMFTAKLAPEDNLVLYENLRFLLGETENDLQLAKQMAAVCDVFVMDAFGSAHRAHASTAGIAQFVPIALAGPLLIQEITALNKVMVNPQKPLLAIIGGAKVSTKLEVLSSLINIVDGLIVGGGMANTLLAAQGVDIGDSLVEANLYPAANNLIKQAAKKSCQILLPIDFVKDKNKILDVGDKSILQYIDKIKTAKTILWNGPLGVFEDPRFAKGTREIAQAIAASTAFSVAGGGDTIAAIDQLNLSSKISYISTGGGAFLEYIEGKNLPGIAALTTQRNL
jgi:phosphoglycerate kinase